APTDQPAVAPSGDDPAAAAPAASTDAASGQNTVDPAGAGDGEAAGDGAPDPTTDTAADRSARTLTARPEGARFTAPGTDRAADIRHQVARFTATRLEDLTGGEKVVLKLDPGHLGRVELTFDARDDRLAVTIVASSTEAEAALRENTRDLTDRIVERSARFSHVDVRVEGRESTDTRQDARQEQRQDDRSDGRRDQGQKDGERDGHHERQERSGHERRMRENWESVMNWELAGPAGEEG
ncbi:flagellar hook-length control protein FliK, partial [bacterium]|nr:flagellar hook-length control protein FliK [bacterium]